jgi:hypothetical protein
MQQEEDRKHWGYRPRADGVISITLDSNMWNWLYKHCSSVRLVEELPQPRFEIFIPREVEIEHLAIPEKEEKRSLRQFIADTIAECRVQTTSYFGFGAEEGEVDRHGTFGFGTFIELDEVRRLEEMRHFYGTRRPSGLARDEGDVMLANQSCFSVVLSCDSKPGPLTYAQERGGKVLFVDERHARQDALRMAVLALLEKS